MRGSTLCLLISPMLYPDACRSSARVRPPHPLTHIRARSCLTQEPRVEHDYSIRNSLSSTGMTPLHSTQRVAIMMRRKLPGPSSVIPSLLLFFCYRLSPPGPVVLRGFMPWFRARFSNLRKNPAFPEILHPLSPTSPLYGLQPGGPGELRAVVRVHPIAICLWRESCRVTATACEAFDSSD